MANKSEKIGVLSETEMASTRGEKDQEDVVMGTRK